MVPHLSGCPSSETKSHQQKKSIRMSLEMFSRFRMGMTSGIHKSPKNLRFVWSSRLSLLLRRNDKKNQHHVLSAYTIPWNPGFTKSAMATTAGRELKLPCDSVHSWALQLSVQQKEKTGLQTLPQNSWLVNNEMLGWTAIVIFGDFLCPATTSVLLSREDPLR